MAATFATFYEKDNEMLFEKRLTRNILCTLFILFFILPYLFLITEFRLNTDIDWEEWLWVARNTLTQSFLSATAGTLIGFLVALGSLSFSTAKRSRYFEALCLLPFYIPTLFFVLALLQVWPQFPKGLWGVVIVNTLMNFGLATLMIREGLQQKAGPSTDLAIVLGSSKFQYFFRVLIPLLRFDLLTTFSFLFITAFLSFSVPLLVGGQQVSSFEIMIYETLRHQQDWSSAVFISLIQSLFLGVIFFFSLRPSQNEKSMRFHQFSWLNLKYFWLVATLPIIILVFGYLISFFQSHFLLHLEELFKRPLAEHMINTLLLAIVTSTISFGLNALASLLYFSTRFSFFIRFYLGPTSALVGFGVLIWGNRFHLPEFIQLSLAYLFVFQIFFLRNILIPRLAELQKQYELSQVLGVSELDFFKKVVFASLARHLFQSSGLFAVWVMGDFAIANMISKQYITLAQVIERLCNNYRLDQALILSTFLGVLIFAVYHVIQKAGHVIDQRTHQKL